MKNIAVLFQSDNFTGANIETTGTNTQMRHMWNSYYITATTYRHLDIKDAVRFFDCSFYPANGGSQFSEPLRPF